MKLKGLTKLVLAGTALAATAATLTTSTYAWYVTNNKVEATGVSGATAGDSVAGSLLISEVDTANNTELPLGYTTSIQLNTAAQTAGIKGLYPQSKAAYAKTKDTALVNGKTYYTFGGENYTAVQTPNVENIGTYYEKDVWVDKDGVIVDNPTMVTFSFWLKASSDMNGINVETTFANSATTAVADALRQTFYSSVGLPTGKKAKETFAVDAVYALRMEVIQQAYTLTYGYDTDGARKYSDDVATKTGTATPIVVGAVENHDATHADADKKYASPKTSTNDNIFDSHDGGDANQYYKSVMKKAPYGTTGFGEADQTAQTVTGASAAEPTDTWTSINLAKDVDTLITINIWLEGTDAQCWDSCVGQNFTLNLKFDKAA